MGETAIDDETFNDYIQEMNSIYTADKVSNAVKLTATRKDSYAGTTSITFLVNLELLHRFLIRRLMAACRLQLQLVHQ